MFATESYGGHYGPEFVTYFDQQNQLIDEGTLKGEKITVSALMINKFVVFHRCWTSRILLNGHISGWFDPLLQNKAYVDFATNAPGYGQLQNDTVIAQLNQAFFEKGGCQDQELACYAAGESPESDKMCRTADDFCVSSRMTLSSFILIFLVGGQHICSCSG